jgi:hypothetical protein
MNRETLKKIERFLTFGDIKQKEDETGCYHITDKAMQKVISGYEEELLTLKRKLVEERIDYRRETAGQVEPEVSDDFGDHTCKTCKYWKALGTDRDEIKFGKCSAPVLFPDSRFARGEGLKKNMREEDGLFCPLYTSQNSR